MRRFSRAHWIALCAVATLVTGCGDSGSTAASGSGSDLDASTAAESDSEGGSTAGSDSAEATDPGQGDTVATEEDTAPSDPTGDPVDDTSSVEADTSTTPEQDVPATPEDTGTTNPEPEPEPEPEPGPQETPIPWNAGPYGVQIMDPAGDFTVPTLDGDWTLSTNWDGLSSYLFVFRYAASDYNTAVWNSDVKALLERAPDGTHLFFGSFDTSWSSDITGMKGRVDAALAQMGTDAQASWANRVHYINTAGFSVTGSLAAFLGEQQMFWFALDRFQRWREIGSLYDWKNDNYPMYFIANESLYFDYEAKIQAEMTAMAPLEVTLWDNHTHPGGWGGGYSSTVEITLPDAETLAGYDGMAIYLYTACPNHKQGKDAGCNEWDYIQNLKLCDVATPNPEVSAQTSCTPADEDTGVTADTMACSCEAPDGTVSESVHTCNAEGTGYGDCACGCGTEFARWVTPYGREGNWLTDLSALLPLVNKGGTRRFRFAGANGYTLHGKLLFYDAGTGKRPVGIRYLWGNPGGTGFNETYNDGKHGDVAFNLPEGADSVSLTAIISGHGHSSTQANCAEFCNHQHAFTVNDASYMEEHPNAGTWYGCMDQTSEGGVPNQFGTWPFGRAGWCAGMDVKLWTVDITSAVNPTNNLLSYEGLFQGQTYTPNITDPGGYLPEVKMTSWLTYYATAP
ncbi:MAG: peptide-N-glycosidase F-related protein [Myxococcota bacterium]